MWCAMVNDSLFIPQTKREVVATDSHLQRQHLEPPTAGYIIRTVRDNSIHTQ